MDSFLRKHPLCCLIISLLGILILHGRKLRRIRIITVPPCLIQLRVSDQFLIPFFKLQEILEAFIENRILLITILQERDQRVPVIKLIFSARFAAVAPCLGIPCVSGFKLCKEQNIGRIAQRPALTDTLCRVLIQHAICPENIFFAVDQLLSGHNAGQNRLVEFVILYRKKSFPNDSLFRQIVLLLTDRTPSFFGILGSVFLKITVGASRKE